MHYVLFSNTLRSFEVDGEPARAHSNLCWRTTTRPTTPLFVCGRQLARRPWHQRQSATLFIPTARRPCRCATSAAASSFVVAVSLPLQPGGTTTAKTKLVQQQLLLHCFFTCTVIVTGIIVGNV
jgi:hypothetical protein